MGWKGNKAMLACLAGLYVLFCEAGNCLTYAFQKFFVVPATKAQRKIPFARVNHNKYMVTESTAYIGNHKCSKIIRVISAVKIRLRPPSGFLPEP